MRGRNTIFLVVIVAILAVIAIATRNAERSRERIDSGPIFSDANWEATAEILMVAESDTVRLRKQDDRWLVASDRDYPADTLLTRSILEKIRAFDRKHLRSRSSEMQTTFEVDDTSGTEVLFAGADGAPMAHFRVGKNGPDFRSQYIRPVESNEVFLIPENLRSTFDVKRATWRDRTIFAFERDGVKRLVFLPEDGETIVVEKDAADNYVITAPDSAAAKQSPIESAVRTLATLRCDAFPDSLPSPAAAGLEPPRQRVEVHMDDGASYGLDFGEEAQHARIYVRKDGDDTIFLLSTGRMKSLVPELESIREEPPPEPEEPAEG